MALTNEAGGKQDPLKRGIKTDYKRFLSPHLLLGFLVTRCSPRDQVFTGLQLKRFSHVVGSRLLTVLSSQANGSEKRILFHSLGKRRKLKSAYLSAVTFSPQNSLAVLLMFCEAFLSPTSQLLQSPLHLGLHVDFRNLI